MKIKFKKWKQNEKAHRGLKLPLKNIKKKKEKRKKIKNRNKVIFF